MKVMICAVGRLRSGPERALVDDYLTRATRTGRSLGLGPVTETEVEDKKGGGSAAEAVLLRNALPRGALLVTLDERGSEMTSPQFANALAKWRDQGTAHVAFVIGGADGIAPDLRDEARASVRFGRMVWPHMLARVMLAEQVYRATTILAGTPYHRS